MLLPQTFSRGRSFSIPTAKVFPLESFAVYGICLFWILHLNNSANTNKIYTIYAAFHGESNAAYRSLIS